MKNWERIPKVLGFGLFLTAALVGFTSATNPPSTQQYWVYVSSLAAGSKISQTDLRSIQLPKNDDLVRYLNLDKLPIGAQLIRDVAAGELAEPSAWQTQVSTLPELTLSFDPNSLPLNLTRGERLDLWVVPQDPAGNAVGSAALVTANLVVANVIDIGSGFSTLQPVTFYTESDQIATILNAIATGQPYLVRR